MALINPVFFTGILYNRHRATSFNGDRGSVDDSTKSDIVNVVPSTNFTMAVSDLGPESSTMDIDFAESFRMMSNSDDVTDGILLESPAALDMVGRKRSVDDGFKILDSRVRRR